MTIAIEPSARHGQDTTAGFAFTGRSTRSKPRLLLLLNDEKYFQVHRLDHARAAKAAGMEVLVATHLETDGRWIEKEGFQYLPSPFVKGIRHPLKDLSAVVRLARLYRRAKPDIVHHFAMKPILYGSWAARLAGVHAVTNTFAGLGTIYAKNGLITRVLRAGVTAGLRSALAIRNSRVLFENQADRERMVQAKVVQSERTAVVGGTGVDVEKFRPKAEAEGVPVVLLACRMLWDKGVGDFVQAARFLKEQEVPARFVLVGTPDPDNPSSISKGQLLSWQRDGAIEWWGYRDDMPDVLASSHIVALPTFYGEGLPRILLEAAACGKPIIATNIPGCAEVVRSGSNGLLIPPKHPHALAEAMKALIQNPSLRRTMGEKGRDIVMREFSVPSVSGQVLAIYRELLGVTVES